MHASLNDARVVEDHQSAFWQIVGQIAECVLPYFTMTIEQQLRTVALSLRELGYPLVG